MSTLDIISAFKARHSVRTFQPDFPKDKAELVDSIIKETNLITPPFGSKVNLQKHEPGLGRFGSISGEAGWIMLVIPKDLQGEERRKAYIDAGDLGQLAVMKLTQNSIGSVWIGGTYDEAKAEESTPDHQVIAGIPFGIECGKHMIAKMLSFFSGSSSRYPVEKLFYNKDKNEPFTEENAGEWKEIIMCLRSGPSALNYQTWRFVIENNNVHLYHAPSREASTFDLGIAIANMELLLHDKGYEIKVLENQPETSPLGGTYQISAVKKD